MFYIYKLATKSLDTMRTLGHCSEIQTCICSVWILERTSPALYRLTWAAVEVCVLTFAYDHQHCSTEYLCYPHPPQSLSWLVLRCALLIFSFEGGEEFVLPLFLKLLKPSEKLLARPPHRLHPPFRLWQQQVPTSKMFAFLFDLIPSQLSTNTFKCTVEDVQKIFFSANVKIVPLLSFLTIPSSGSLLG